MCHFRRSLDVNVKIADRGVAVVEVGVVDVIVAILV
jgi:hypothetical protein